MWQTWRAITCMVCRDLHLKSLFSGLLQKDLFKGRWSLMEGHDYSHACHSSHTNICCLLSTVVNRDKGIEISGAYVPTIYPVPGDHKGESNAKCWADRHLFAPSPPSGRLEQVTHHQITKQPVGTWWSGPLRIQLPGRKARLEGQQSWARKEKHQPIATISHPGQVSMERVSLQRGRSSVHTPAGLLSKVLKMWWDHASCD